MVVFTISLTGLGIHHLGDPPLDAWEGVPRMVSMGPVPQYLQHHFIGWLPKGNEGQGGGSSALLFISALTSNTTHDSSCQTPAIMLCPQ